MYDKSPCLIIDYHRSMLADSERTRTHEQAINETVKPGDVVLDLGCGTGILSCFACRAGARRVYAVEMGSIIGLAQSICRDNGFDERVVFLNDVSTRIELPERVDVVITETIGNFALDEGILGWAMDAGKRFLKPGGTIIPKWLELFLAPVELPDASQRMETWRHDLYGFDFSRVRMLAVNNLDWLNLAADAFLGEPGSLMRIDLAQVTSDRMDSDVVLNCTRSGICHGVGGWFVAALTDDLLLSNESLLTTPSWRHAFLPFERPLSVEQGDRLRLKVTVRANGALWLWQVEQQRWSAFDGAFSGIAAFKHSTWQGQLMSIAELRKQAPSHTPTLSDKGEIDRFVLNNMDGSASLEELARRTVQRFPDRFSDSKRALKSIRKLSRKYSC